MNKYLYFCVGAAIGSFVTWRFLKDKYEKEKQEEIDSVKETFAKAKAAIAIATSEAPKDKPDLKSYTETTVGYSYQEEPQQSKTRIGSGIYIIAPTEFGDFPDYNLISLRYFSDGVIIDANGEILDDADGIVEEDFVDHFGEYETDSVYIRNDMRCCDYEILKEERTYKEYMEEK